MDTSKMTAGEASTAPPKSPAATIVELMASASAKNGKRPVGSASLTKKPRRENLFPDEPEASPKEAGKVDEPDAIAFVPEVLHKKLEYSRRGESELRPGEAELFVFVANECTLPKDLEADHAYGPLSGTSFEARAISAYALGLLHGCGLSPAAEAAYPEVRSYFIDGNFTAAAAVATEAVAAAAETAAV